MLCTWSTDSRDLTLLDPQAALRTFWDERRALARAARAGLDFSGAVRPSRAAPERDWVSAQADAPAPSALRENPVVLDEPPRPQRRRQ